MSCVDKCSVAALLMLMAGSVCALPAVVVAESGTPSLPVVKAFPSPTGSPRGLEYDGTYLYLVQAATTDRIFKLDRNSGATVDSYDWTLSSFPSGIAWDGASFYVSDINSGEVYVVASDFSFIRSFSAPEASQRDLAFDGSHLLEATSSTNKVWTLDPTDGGAVGSFDAPNTQPAGVAWDGSHIWLSDSLQNLIYKLDTDGAIIEQYQGPGWYPTGLAFDGSHLWLVDWGTQTIYKLKTDASMVPALWPAGLIGLVVLLLGAGGLVLRGGSAR